MTMEFGSAAERVTECPVAPCRRRTAPCSVKMANHVS